MLIGLVLNGRGLAARVDDDLADAVLAFVPRRLLRRRRRRGRCQRRRGLV